MSLLSSWRRTFRLTPTFALALAALTCGHAAAQPDACDRGILAQSEKLNFPYVARSGGYCDGTVAFDNGAVLQLVSYTMGPVRFSPDQPHVTLKVASSSNGQSVRVIGVDKRPTGSYRFDAIPPASGIDFDLKAAVHPKGLKAEHLGFVAWINRNGSTLYLPVAVGAPEAGDSPVMVMRAPTAVVQAAYEICIQGQPCGPQELWARDLEAGSQLELKLPKGPSLRQAAVKITVVGPGNRTLGDVLQMQIP